MINPETLTFLTNVAENNNREWFAENKEQYEVARANVLGLVERLIPLIAAVDPGFPVETEAKRCVMRIYRDIRFSKNKLPYKSNFGISFMSKQVKGPEYYLHLQPGKSFFAVGYWMPEASDLKLIREEIDYNTDEFLEIIEGPSFKSLFTVGREDSLVKAPKGYDPGHPHIDLLKLKSFVASFPIKNSELFKPTIINQLRSAFEIAYPFVQFLRKAIVQ